MAIPLMRTFVALAATLTGLLPATAAAAHAPAGTTYYVDCLRGSDDAPGTGTATAWRTLDRASRAYGPGDRLLLRRGRTCAGVLAPTGSGTAAEPISIDAYGKGAKPRIEGGGARAAVLLLNVEGWEVRNLDISNTGAPTTTDRRAGLLVRLTDFGTGSHYVVDGVDVHDVNGADFKDPDPSGGILFSVTGSAVPTRFDGVRIEDSTVRRTDRTGIGTSSTWGRRPEHPNGPGTSWEAITGLRIHRNEVYDVGGDGIVVQTAKGALVEHNYVNGFNMRSAGYNAGIWAWNSDDVLYQYNEVTGGHGTLDSMAYDIDGGNNRNVYQYNYSHDNEGGFLLVCNGAGMTTNGNRVRHNISVNDRNTMAPYGVVSVVCAPTTDTQIYANTIVTDRADTALVSNNGPTGVTFRNNVFVGAPSAGSPIIDTRSVYENNLYWHTSQPRDPAALTADPLFVSASPTTPRDVRLSAGSPALGAGLPIGDGLTRDYFGNRIPNPPNLGADQDG
ncbi:right-handed parallel beta-helix repeat-containing protein [Streptomyces sp. FIT100]|uniref:right-handed parallel beta-helix repeat-containing protein n=1 Tax=Streptomyces sp. FIT100 TaxID=2837956 RepID=UPI0021C762A1|nr:right-handed parallel beta-helix repeat-containing protein [Streptomyces sp. FIT100]UUN28889.1 right-handed parallel beta-helix repeat-containing protein [Streptomyces sp. FIT100]